MIYELKFMINTRSNYYIHISIEIHNCDEAIDQILSLTIV